MKGIKANTKFKLLVKSLFFTIGLLLITVVLFAAPKPKPVPPPIQLGQDGKLIYRPDSLGNRIPDYSYCGYQASEQAIPFIPVKVIMPVIKGDATEYLQRAIDYVAGLPLDENGFRGAILLQKGEYHLNGRFKINTSGIIIRGSGFSQNGTKLIASGQSRETLFRIEGKQSVISSDTVLISDKYVPVNALTFNVDNSKGLEKGSTIFITRPSTKEWIDLLKMKSFGGETEWLGWRPGERNIVWDRTVTAVVGNSITIDAPITTALDQKYGGGFINVYNWPERVTNIGIENLQLESSYNSENIKDEEHCWNAISFDNARDCWVRQVTFAHFAGSAVATYETTLCITIEDCISKDPVSEIAAYRRNSFFTAGQQNLIQRCYAEYGWNDFSTGFMAAGPNAFVQCESHLPNSFSGAADSWASGVLFDIVNVDGQKLSFNNRGQDAQGAGWTAANSMFWQCSAAKIECFEPIGADNWAFGTWAQFAGNGYWYEANSHIKPSSLFYAQLGDRIGKTKLPEHPVMEISTNATSSPTVEMAADIVAYFAEHPVQTLREWITEAPQRNPISVKAGKGVISVNDINIEKKFRIEPDPVQTSIRNGWLVKGDALITGKRVGAPWWNMNVRPRGIKRSKIAVTRYVPGLVGKGYTDDLDDVITEMQQNDIVAYEQNYALWYERRRDDHERIRRMDADVWAPFYELPFARTGIDFAWDHLSKYDLTKYNPWYWGRLKKFADLADRNGQVLIHQNYFQHNIIEAGAHWVDSPWRTVNNINNTDFPEPPPFAGDKRIFVANYFYDETHPVRRELHRKYIRQCLENFKDNTCVIQTTSEEFTGPLHFVEFWLDVVDEWEKETGHDALIALSTTKDVQDTILADTVRSKVVDIIDIRYWSSRPDGTVYEPKGGLNLAPRQHARLEKIGKRSVEQVYNDVLKYRKLFPDKAVLYSEGRYTNMAWGIFMASGSLAPIPRIEAAGFLSNASTMKVVDSETDRIYQLQNTKGESIYYVKGKDELKTDLCSFSGKFDVEFIDPEDGNLIGKSKKIEGGQMQTINLKGKSEVVVWVHK